MLDIIKDASQICVEQGGAIVSSSTQSISAGNGSANVFSAHGFVATPATTTLILATPNNPVFLTKVQMEKVNQIGYGIIRDTQKVIFRMAGGNGDSVNIQSVDLGYLATSTVSLQGLSNSNDVMAVLLYTKPATSTDNLGEINYTVLTSASAGKTTYCYRPTDIYFNMGIDFLFFVVPVILIFALYKTLSKRKIEGYD